MDDQKAIRDAMDACRPDELGGAVSRDAPELAALEQALQNDPASQAMWERSSRLDSAISQAFEKVEVPHGLQDRLLESVRAQTVAPVEPVAPARLGRRRLLWSLGLAVSALLVIAFFIWKRTHRDIEVTDLSNFGQSVIADSKAAWETSEAPQGFALPVNVARPAELRWRRLSAEAGLGDAVAYDLSAGRNGSVVLIVIQSNRRVRAKASPQESALSPVPFRPLQATGGLSIGAWSGKGKIFLLVGRMNKRQLRSYLRPLDIT